MTKKKTLKYEGKAWEHLTGLSIFDQNGIEWRYVKSTGKCAMEMTKIEKIKKYKELHGQG
jgi:hypothetical protein